MSEISQGPGWWLASDGRWYPPETHPDYVAPPPPPSLPMVPTPGTPTAGVATPGDVTTAWATPGDVATSRATPAAGAPVVDPANWGAPPVPPLNEPVTETSAGWGATPPASPTADVTGPSAWAASALGDPPTVEAPASGSGSIGEPATWTSPDVPTPGPAAWSTPGQPATPSGDPIAAAQPWQTPPPAAVPPPAGQQPWQPSGQVLPGAMPAAPMPGAPMPGGPQAWQPSGPLGAPPGAPPWQPGAPPGYGAPAPSTGGMPGWLKALLIIGVVVAVLGVGVVGCAAFVANRASDSVSSFSNALEKSFGEADTSDYSAEVTACTVTENGTGSLAEGTLKNTSGKKQGFLLTVNFLDARGNVVSSGIDTVSIQAGKTAKWTVRPTTLKDIKTCEIDSVNYTLFDN